MSDGRAGTEPVPVVLRRIADAAAGQMAAENFPVALRFLPRQPRDRLTRVYAFARFVDDVGDEAPGTPGDRLELLDAVSADLRALAEGRAQLPVVAALAPVIHDVPLEPFLDLVEANRIDQNVNRYETFDDLLGYCRYSAAPVGRIVLHLAAAVTARNVADSDAICNGLQVLEHCQDVGEDARAGRVYLPAADLSGITADELRGHVTSPRLRAAVAVNVDRADTLLQAASLLTRRLSGWARLAVTGYAAGGLATVAALRRNDYDVLSRTIRPTRLRTAAAMARLLAHRAAR